MKMLRSTVALTAMIVSLSAATQVSAQQAAPSQTDEAQLTQDGQGQPGGPTSEVAPEPVSAGDIIVTANKRAENVQRVPLAVSVVAPAQLAAAGVRNFTDIGKVSSSLVVRPAEQPQNSNISLRGVGTFAFGIGVESSVAVLVDEVPLAFQRDFSDTSLFQPTTGRCGPGVIPGGGLPLPSPLPLPPPPGNCEEVGIGDSTFQLLFRGPKAAGGDWVFGARFDVPTASQDILGSGTLAASPIVAYVRDLKIPGSFVAFMNLYKFDVWKDSTRSDVSAYIGRWFLMLPVSKKARLYLLPELQPIYDFESSHFSLWFAPELGHLLRPGNILYVKPGWGFGPDQLQGDRKFTFEIGWRKFL